MKKSKLLKVLLVTPLFIGSISLASCGVSNSSDSKSPFVEPIFETYTCRFFDATGTKVVYETKVKEHENVKFEGSLPEKNPTTYNEYTFIGWSESLDDITKSTDFYPEYSEAVRTYYVTFVGEDGEVLEKVPVKAGEEAQYSGATPTKPSDDDYDYTFSGWTSDVSEVTGDMTVSPTFEKSVRKYQVSFNVDGKTIHSQMVEKGKTIGTYTGPTPSKPDEEISSMYKKVYVFTGWSVNLVTTVVTADLVVDANFTSKQELSDRFEFGDLVGGGSGNTTGETGSVDADKPGSDEGDGDKEKIEYKTVFIGKDATFPGYYLGYEDSHNYYLLQYKNTVEVFDNNNNKEAVEVEYLVPFEYKKIAQASGTCRFTFPNGKGEILFTFGMNASELNVVKAINIRRSVSGDVNGYLSSCENRLTENIIPEHNVQLRGYISRLGNQLPNGFNLYL